VTRVLITDGNQRSTLAAVRALGSAGIETIVGDTACPTLASRSRYCRSSITYPSPYADETGFVSAIRSAADRESIDLILPMTDITSAVLAEHRDCVASSARVAVVDAETFWRASDKNALHRLATRVGVPHPTVLYCDSSDDRQRALNGVFPCVVKPARSCLRTPSGWIKTAVEIAHSRAQLATLLESRPALQYGFMIQRRIEGEGTGVFALCDRGEVRALFAHRRLREKPPWGGVSVLREAVPVDPAAAEYARALLHELRWHGVAMVEFRKEHSTGIPYLMEVNGRFWGSLQLSIDAGINFPVQLVRLWTGEAVLAENEYRVGVRSRWLLGDVDHLLMRLRANGATPADAPTLPHLFMDFCQFFRRDTRYEVESLRDPGPSLHELQHYVRDLLRPHRRSRG
jgi:predicted ATP-grasp superfamily ATP-dependent carboligase